VKTLVITDTEKYCAAVVRAVSPEAAMGVAHELYDLSILKAPSVTPVSDLPDGELKSVLQSALWSVKGFITTVPLWEVTKDFSPKQAREALENLAIWVSASEAPHPWLRPRTAYDDEAEREFDHWIRESGVEDDIKFSSDRQIRMQLWRARNVSSGLRHPVLVFSEACACVGTA
jgi:hypothetical protein